MTMLWQILRGIYSILWWLLLPFIFFRLWMRSFRLSAYRGRWAERLGRVPFAILEQSIWVHAVSVGESLAAVPLIQGLIKQYPNHPIVMTTTTPTGSARIKAAFKDSLGKNVFHCYLPYDAPFALKAFFKHIQPKILILMETELWPNVLEYCYQQKVPVVMANARLSPKSAKHYQYLGPLLPYFGRAITAVAAQSAIDVERFAALKIDNNKIHLIGNIKFDLKIPEYLPKAGLTLRQQLGPERLIWIAASTHEGEERLMIEVFKQLKPQFPNLLLLLVPRHPDRFEKVATLCQQSKLVTVRRSSEEGCSEQTDVFLGDTMGELLLFYAASDIALVGGSFVPIGGHNLLEPAWLGLPILTGPHVFNFTTIGKWLIEANGLIQVADQKALEGALVDLLQNASKRRGLGQNAKKVASDNRGALDRLLSLITEYVQ